MSNLEYSPGVFHVKAEGNHVGTFRDLADFFMFCLPSSLYNLVNKANLVHNLFLVYLY